ncbi:myo-inositol 2-dehydrogenase [Veronia nyctiphanis]|uniref:Myo-inositol 2-dehydrogenase n=1 Tax=Veronia nyctiphanis TaxID=1278244 RepID=A0A4Q0YTH1_9GAMM|nr:Gfo/Idh/MocA family oxidoreductase [Veronia nyctiphanis]RXJ74520.1 myo-inositol 2-dehydrogenase [Veronia nyctiphanis]
MIRTGLVGFGLSSTTFHLPFLSVLPDYQVTAVVSSKPDIVKVSVPDAKCYSDIEQMLREEELELVVIGSPNHTHYNYTKQALEADCHVLVEKPFVTHSGQGLELINVARERGKILCPYQNRRWDGDFLTIKNLINENELGEVKVFESHFDRYRPDVSGRWREMPGEGTGMLFDLGSHLIDQALVLFGDPDAISARSHSMREQSQAVDYFRVIMHYKDKEIILGSSPFRSGKGLRFEVQGTKATFTVHGVDIQEKQLRDGLPPTYSEFGRQQHQATLEVGDTEEVRRLELEHGCYSELFSQLARAISDDAAPPVNAEDATKVIYAIELAQHAADTGKTHRWEF